MASFVEFRRVEYVTASRLYGVMVGFQVVAQFVAWRMLRAACKTPAHYAALSVASVMIHASIDCAGGISILSCAAEDPNWLYVVVFFAVWGSAIYGGCAVTVGILQAMGIVMHQPLNPQQQHYLVLLGMGWCCTMVGAAAAVVLMSQVPALCLALFLPFAVQIGIGAWSARRRAGDEPFQVLMIVQRLVTVLYSFGFDGSIHGDPSRVTVGIAGGVAIAEVVIMLLQNWIGPAWFVPRRWARGRGARVAPATTRSSCPICLETIEIGDEAMIAPCGHSGHPSCWRQWAEVQAICPVCRAPV